MLPDMGLSDISDCSYIQYIRAGNIGIYNRGIIVMRKIINMKQAREKRKVVSNCPHCQGALLPNLTMSEFYNPHAVLRCFQCSRYFRQNGNGKILVNSTNGRG